VGLDRRREASASIETACIPGHDYIATAIAISTTDVDKTKTGELRCPGSLDS